MTGAEDSFLAAIQSRYPGLLEKVRQLIRENENAFESNENPESFLWEHTLHVASIAHQLAQREHIDPLLVIVAALFHDAGKFVAGKYHEEQTIEEEESARVAEPILRQVGMKAAHIHKVLAGVRALYNQKGGRNKIGALLHDADFLSKFGAMGVASFFTKATLRGRTLRSALLGHLSKELTYAACLPLNMRTESGRRLAIRKARDSIRFFHSLLEELREAGIADLKVRPIRIPFPSRPKESLLVRLVHSPVCPECGARWNMEWSTEEGVKCERLNVRWQCPDCARNLETSFCLPEMA